MGKKQGDKGFDNLLLRVFIDLSSYWISSFINDAYLGHIKELNLF